MRLFAHALRLRSFMFTHITPRGSADTDDPGVTTGSRWEHRIVRRSPELASPAARRPCVLPFYVRALARGRFLRFFLYSGFVRPTSFAVKQRRYKRSAVCAFPRERDGADRRTRADGNGRPMTGVRRPRAQRYSMDFTITLCLTILVLE